jgi:adenosylcobinamide kinase / adenosylcobinamide-phosphate guanylyltransferase
MTQGDMSIIRRCVLITGGARSGKSAYAETLAARVAGDRPVLYVASAHAGDEEMRERILAHQARRPAHWVTLEAPLSPAEAIRAASVEAPVVLLDCVTLLVSNILLAALGQRESPTTAEAKSAERQVYQAIEDLLQTYRTSARTFILVSNEVGMGVVPSYALGRIYRDALGRVNARLAQEADAVLLMVAGMPIEIKELAARWQEQAAHLWEPEGR